MQNSKSPALEGLKLKTTRVRDLAAKMPSGFAQKRDWETFSSEEEEEEEVGFFVRSGRKGKGSCDVEEEEIATSEPIPLSRTKLTCSVCVFGKTRL